VLTIPPPYLLSFHILRPALRLLPLFLPQDTVNALSYLLGFFHFPFECKIPLIECVLLTGYSFVPILFFGRGRGTSGGGWRWQIEYKAYRHLCCW